MGTQPSTSDALSTFVTPSIWASNPTIAVSASSLPSLIIAMLGDCHCAGGTNTGVGGGVVSTFLVTVTTAPVSDATALKETLPE